MLTEGEKNSLYKRSLPPSFASQNPPPSSEGGIKRLIGKCRQLNYSIFIKKTDAPSWLGRLFFDSSCIINPIRIGQVMCRIINFGVSNYCTEPKKVYFVYIRQTKSDPYAETGVKANSKTCIQSLTSELIILQIPSSLRSIRCSKQDGLHGA